MKGYEAVRRAGQLLRDYVDDVKGIFSRSELPSEGERVLGIIDSSRREILTCLKNVILGEDSEAEFAKFNAVHSEILDDDVEEFSDDIFDCSLAFHIMIHRAVCIRHLDTGLYQDMFTEPWFDSIFERITMPEDYPMVNEAIKKHILANADKLFALFSFSLNEQNDEILSDYLVPALCSAPMNYRFVLPDGVSPEDAQALSQEYIMLYFQKFAKGVIQLCGHYFTGKS